MESHLLQMRGLKLQEMCRCEITKKALSHLLQMRGLKLQFRPSRLHSYSRIFYRCVD